MDLNNLKLFQMIDVERSYLTERQKVLAANVANANTPNYLPRDIEKPKFNQELKKNLELKVTNPNHLRGLKSGGFAYTGKVYTPKPKNPLSIDGNGVVVEDQMNEVSKTKGEYNRMITIYNAYKNMIKVASTKLNV